MNHPTSLTDENILRFDSDEVGLDRLPPSPPPYGAGRPAMAPSASRAEPWPILPGFEILSVLGRGGMGTVYRARELHLQRIVAIKMLRAREFADPDERARFLREAQTLAGLQHPNIVHVFQSGEAHGQLYLVMECVDGGSLERRLNGLPLPPQTAGAVLEVLARTMDYVHGRGLLHRDLKLANILVASNAGQPLTPQVVKITDFGLAKRFDKDGTDAPSQAIVGTPNYMAPEQASGQPATPASDVYALGAILYELLTGRPPFAGTSWMDTVQQVLTTDPVPPRRLHAKVPRDLETICMHCLHKDPGKRYAGAAALADDLQRYLAGQPIHARPITWWERTAKWARRRPAVFALLAALVVVTLCGFGMVTWKWLDEAQANVDLLMTQNARITAREALAREQLENEAKQMQAESSRRRDYALTLADRAWLNNHPERCQDMLNLCPPDLRRWEWYFLRNRLHSGQTVLHADLYEVNHCSFNADGSMFATAGGQHTDAQAHNDVKLWDPATGKLLFTLGGHQGPVTWVAFHPHQNVLVSLSTRVDFAAILRGDPRPLNDVQGECIVWDLDKKKPLAALPDSFGWGAMSENGDYLAVAGADHRVRIWDCSTPWPWKEVAKLPPYPGLVKQLAFSPDGKLLARAGLQFQGIDRGELLIASELKLWHTATGAEERALPIPRVEIDALAFHPGGRLLAWSNGALNTATLWDLKTDQPVPSVVSHAGTIHGLTFHPNGKWLASAGKDRVVKLWDVATGEALHTLRGHTAAVQAVSFAPDKAKHSRGLASGGADGTVRFWDPAGGQEPITLRGPAMAVTQVGYSPDGRRIVARATGGPIRIWDATTHKLLLNFDSQAEHFAYSPDGKRLVTGGGDFRKPELPGELIVWDAETGKRLHTLAGHTRHVGAVAWSSDGKRIASASGNPFKSPGGMGEIIFWDGSTYEQVLKSQPPIGYVSALQFSPDNRQLALATQSRILHLVDPASATEIRSLAGHADPVACVAFSRDGRHLASGDVGGNAILWDAATGQRTLTLRASAAAVHNLAFHPDGSRLATAAFDPAVQGLGGIQLWDTTTGQELLSLPGQFTATFSPNGRQLAGAAAGNLTRPGAIHIWEAPPTAELASWRTSSTVLFGTTFTPDGRQIAIANITQHKGRVTFYDVVTQRETTSLPPQDSFVVQLAFDPKNERRMATVHSGGAAKIWDLTNASIPVPTSLVPPHAAWVSSVQFSPDGKTLATCSHDQTIKLWDSQGGLLQDWKAHDRKIFDLKYRPDGAALATAGADKIVRLWDVATRQEVRHFAGHAQPPLCLAFQPAVTGTKSMPHLLAAGDGDNSVTLWDHTTGEAWAKLTGHTGPVRAVLFSADGRYLFSAGDDQTIKSWDVLEKKEIVTQRGHYDRVRSLALHPKGKWLVSASYDQSLKLWNVPDLVATTDTQNGEN